MNKNAKILFAIVIIAVNASVSCDNEEDNEKKKVITEEKTSWVNIPGRNDFDIPAWVVIPSGEGPHPAIVVLHGCGGLLSDSNNGSLASHFQFWEDFGKANKVAMIFADSFTPRGLNDFCGYAPPDDAICSPAYERPMDVADILMWISQQDFIDSERLGLLGFSHGGSTAISSIVDTDYVSFSARTVRNDGITYIVPGPVEMPESPRFKVAVAYYPGAGFYGYFGNDYLPYAPLIIHAATLDPLYTSGSTEELITTAQQNGASDSAGNPVTLYVYQDAAHSFDGKLSGADSEASQLARTRTIAWFKSYLTF